MAAVILGVINGYLGDRGLSLRQGTIVDPTLIHAPSSTKNKEGKRDPEMHQTKKGNQYYFGAKAHIGVDDESGLVHSVVVTAANVADTTQVDKLLHGAENVVCADAGYTGIEKREEHAGRQVIWQVAARRSDYPALVAAFYLALTLQYLLIYFDWYGLFSILSRCTFFCCCRSSPPWAATARTSWSGRRRCNGA